jgi:hypothetical protein
MKFGYLPQEKSLTTDFLEIRTLPDIDLYDQIEASWPDESKGWIYPPTEYNEKQREKYPLKAAPWFGLEPSHDLELKQNVKDHEAVSRFVVLVFGFLNGLHLMPEGWGYLMRTAIKPGTLVGFIIKEQDEGLILEMIVERYLNLSSHLKKLEYALVHWFLMGQAYSRLFDRFSAQYQVSDLVYRIAVEKGLIHRVRHSDRIRISCDALRIVTPEWALPGANGLTQVAEIRNELIHEATFAGEPIGMKVPGMNISFQITRLNELLVLRTLGIEPPRACFPNQISRMTYLVKYGTG